MENMYVDILYIYRRCRRHNTSVLPSVIESLERFNRPLLWRSFEYIFFLLQLITRSSVITNLSIGRYQIKISYILDSINIAYTLDEKKLH